MRLDLYFLVGVLALCGACDVIVFMAAGNLFVHTVLTLRVP
jgi:hypothetical protein